MIIDIHGHTTAPDALYAYNYKQMMSRGDYGKMGVKMSDDEVRDAMKGHIALLDAAGTDLQLIMPRPWGIPAGQGTEKIMPWITEMVNDLIARQVAMHPDRCRGVAGLPQVDGVSPENCVAELERGIKELGFVGCMINPDPGEGAMTTPPMGDKFWYPLYEKMCELDVPGIIHTGNCCHNRVTQSEHFINEEAIAGLSLLRSTVFGDFPNLKLVLAHGGGWIPYQVGRFRGGKAYANNGAKSFDRFDDALRQLHFDTVLYNQEAIDLLLKIVGSDNCLFGSDRPAAASKRSDPDTGRILDDIRPLIEASDFLDDTGRQAVFEGNARRLFAL